MRTIFLALSCAALVGCTAVSVSPPLSSRTPATRAEPGTVALTSGQFRRPYRVVGVFQLTQTGYRWFHEVEVNADAHPGSILYQVAHHAHAHGADGVQFLELVDTDPQTPSDRASKQVDSAVRIADAFDKGTLTAGDVAGEGTKTRWEVRGELIRFVD